MEHYDHYPVLLAEHELGSGSAIGRAAEAIEAALVERGLTVITATTLADVKFTVASNAAIGAALLDWDLFASQRELDGVVELAKSTGAADDPLIRERLTRSWAGLRAMRSYALATMDVEQPGQDNVSKLLWANWHRDLGEIAMDVRGKTGMVLDGGDFDEWQRLYLFTRADTIYGGSNEIQRNIIAERVLGLPREAR